MKKLNVIPYTDCKISDLRSIPLKRSRVVSDLEKIADTLDANLYFFIMKHTDGVGDLFELRLRDVVKN